MDVFFVVSGFLITGLLLREFARDGRISLRGFYAGRIRRILPAALLVLVVVTAAAYFVFNRPRAEQTHGDAIAAALLVSNWRFAAQGTDYFHAADAVSPLQHFWTLSVEEQFYLIWPGLLVLAVLLIGGAGAKHARTAVAAVVVVTIGASLVWAAAQTVSEPTVAYFSTATRAWELAAGAALAVASPLFERMPAVLRVLLGWAGLVVVVWSFFAIDPDTTPFPMPGALLPVAGAMLIIAGGIGGRQRHLVPLTNPLSVFVGDISYSLYLWHFPVLVFAAVLLPAGDATTFLVLGVAVLLAVTTYFGFERPLHRSPWLTGVSRGDNNATPGPIEPPQQPQPVLPEQVAAALAISSRREGLAPGARYYPGSRPRQTVPVTTPESLDVPVSADVPDAPVDVEPQSALDPRESGPEASAVIASDAESADPQRSWAAWRARYAGQAGLAAASLGVGVVVVVVIVQLIFGPFALGYAGSDAAPADVVTGDPIAEVQAEIAAAVSATSWPQLNPSLDQVIASSSSDNPAHGCFVPEIVPDLAACTWGRADAPRHMYLVGDSSAMSYAPAFKALAEGSGGAWRITTVGLYGCRFTDVLVDNSGAGVMDACPQRKNDVRAMVAADPADLVVVSNAYSLGRTVDGRDLSASELLAATQAEVVPYAATHGVVYLAPPPRGQHLGLCYSPLSGPDACLSAVERVWHDMQSAAEAVAAASGDYTIDSLPFSCVEDVCPAFAGTLPLRYDDTHLTVAYSERIAPVLRADLAALGLF